MGGVSDSHALESLSPTGIAFESALLQLRSLTERHSQPAQGGKLHSRQPNLLCLAMTLGNDLCEIGLFFLCDGFHPLPSSRKGMTKHFASLLERNDSAVEGRNITECQELCVQIEQM